MTSPLILPDPSCSFGYPLGQLGEILSSERLGEFWVWAKRERRLVRYCTGYDFRLNVVTGNVERIECTAAHGFAIYRDDLAGYLEQAAA